MIFSFQVLVVIEDLDNVLLCDLVVEAVAFRPLDQATYLLHKYELHYLLLVIDNVVPVVRCLSLC